jgi:hypothetical protein
MGGRVTVNFGPKFKYELPEGASPYFFARDIRFFPDDKAVTLPLANGKSADSLPMGSESSVHSDLKAEESDQMDQTY